jgi:ferrochelatase
MGRFSAADGFRHDQPETTAVLAVQLGTPAAPKAAPVRRYLAQFLSDPRVIEIPRIVWLPILHGIILRTRPARSAAKYATIWTPEGSPLAVHSRRQAALLGAELSGSGHQVEVALAMRYGEPSIGSVLRELRERNLTRLLVLPLYPQYAGSSVGTALDAVMQELATWRNPPELRTIKHFHDDPGYIGALAARVREHWAREGEPEQLLMSFHGVPESTLLQGDPYHCECLVSARLLAQELGLPRERWRVSFQSRLGRARWLQPYTEAVLRELGERGTRRLDVICPGFVADCLETLEEIAIEGRETYEGAGGHGFRYIGCLNDSPAFAQALASLAQRHLRGWPTARLDARAQTQADARLAERLERARSAGATV